MLLPLSAAAQENNTEVDGPQSEFDQALIALDARPPKTIYLLHGSCHPTRRPLYSQPPPTWPPYLGERCLVTVLNSPDQRRHFVRVFQSGNHVP